MLTPQPQNGSVATEVNVIATQIGTGQARNTKVRFPGICRDARILGVHRVTLFRALTGQWRLPGLVRRHEALKAEQSSSTH